MDLIRACEVVVFLIETVCVAVALSFKDHVATVPLVGVVVVPFYEADAILSATA